MTKQPQKEEGEEKGKQEEKEEEKLDDGEAGNVKKNTKPMTIKKRMLKQKDSNNDNNSIDWLFSRTLYPLSFPRRWWSIFFYRNYYIICLFIRVLMHIFITHLYVWTNYIRRMEKGLLRERIVLDLIMRVCWKRTRDDPANPNTSTKTNNNDLILTLSTYILKRNESLKAVVFQLWLSLSPSPPTSLISVSLVCPQRNWPF